MKKFLAAILSLVMVFGSAAALADMKDYDIATDAATNKVILDTDMGYMGDDSYCMFILTQADAAGWIDLLGITTVGANVTVAEGMTATLNQLDIIGRGDVPVYFGTDIPIMGIRDLDAAAKVYGTPGASTIKKMSRYQTYGAFTYDNIPEALFKADYGYSTLKPQTDMGAVDFMIEQVKKYPGQVTVFAIGAATNVALACMKDPSFAKNTAGIIYMGGAFDVPGNSTFAAELNWFYDPDSVQICLNADFPYQIIVPHDIASRVILAKDVFDAMNANERTPITQLILDKQYQDYLDNPTKTRFCWDAITAAVFLCPDLITESEVRDVAMETTKSYNYGKSCSWAVGEGPVTAKEATIVFNVDRDAFWDFVNDLYATTF